MKKKTVTVLLIIVLVLLIAVSGVLGFLWYRDNHIFVEDAVYPINATFLDLREAQISIAHYDQVHALLPQCEILWNVPFQGTAYPNDTQSIRIETLTQADGEILLNYFPRLASLDAAGCHDYALLESIQAQRPDWAVTYQVDLGGSQTAQDTQELELEWGSYDYETLEKNIPHLPKLKQLHLRKPELTLEQIDALRESFPNLEITCTVELMGQEYDMQTQELDLSGMTADDLPKVLEKLPLLPQLTKVELMDAQGNSGLGLAGVKQLMEALPQASVHYTFEFYGQTLSTDQEEVTLKNQSMGDEAEQELRDALDIMPKCKRFVLDNCKFSSEVLAQVREDYRDRTKIVWRVWFGEGGSSLTDATAIRVCGGLYDSNSKSLRYCEDVVYMDLGHDEFLNDCEFISGMPNLEYLIISGSQIRTLEPFRVCKKLKFLEIAFCGYIDDVSPLAECTSLEMLNISNTKVTDLSPLDELPLTHMVSLAWETGDWMPTEEKTRFEEKHPDCWTQFGKGQPYGDGWRYTGERDPEYLPYYQQIRDVFMYDIYPNCPNNNGWYFEEKTKWTNPPLEQDSN